MSAPAPARDAMRPAPAPGGRAERGATRTVAVKVTRTGHVTGAADRAALGATE